MALMAEHGSCADAEICARQASRQCARTCGALTRVRRACLVPAGLAAGKCSQVNLEIALKKLVTLENTFCWI